MRARCRPSFRMLRCCSTIISGQCFWEEQPRQRGNAGDGSAGELKGCCLERLMFSTSWVIAMDRYVIIALCYVLPHGCCAAIGVGVGDEMRLPVQTSSIGRLKKSQRKI